MKRWTWTGALIVLGVFAMGAYARGQRDWGGGPRGDRSFRGAPRLLAMLENDRVKAELGLTEDQTSRLRQIIVESQKSSVKTGADMAVRRIELRELLRAENPDRATVLKKVQEISDLRGQMMKQHVEALLAAKTVLSPEQQKKMRRLMQARRNGFWRGPEGRDRSVGPPNRPGFPSQGPGIPGEPPVE